MKKLIFLVLTLAIPVSIFLFLKLFGSNTFEVAVLFEEGIPECAGAQIPHTVPSFEFIGETEKNIISEEIEGFLVFGVLDGINIENNNKKLVELVRIQDAFYEIGAPNFILFIQGDLASMSSLINQCTEAGLDAKTMDIAFVPNDQLMDLLQCGIALIDEENRDFNNLVMVDANRDIRGIYDYRDVEQTDKLILELKILKQKS